jgi:hypothetical protein
MKKLVPLETGGHRPIWRRIEGGRMNPQDMAINWAAQQAELLKLRESQTERATKELEQALERALLEPEVLPIMSVRRHIALALMREMVGREWKA